MSTKTHQKDELIGLLTRAQWDKIENSPEMKKKHEEAVEFFKKVDWNEWKKVFAEAESNYKKYQEED